MISRCDDRDRTTKITTAAAIQVNSTQGPLIEAVTDTVTPCRISESLPSLPVQWRRIPLQAPSHVISLGPAETPRPRDTPDQHSHWLPGAPARLSLISRHFRPSAPAVEINTPFSLDRRIASSLGPTVAVPAATTSTMSKQADHPTLLVPGPIEFDDAVLQAMSHYRCVPANFWSKAQLTVQ